MFYIFKKVNLKNVKQSETVNLKKVKNDKVNWENAEK